MYYVINRAWRLSCNYESLVFTLRGKKRLVPKICAMKKSWGSWLEFTEFAVQFTVEFTRLEKRVISIVA